MSYSFDEVCNFKAGEQYWENCQSGCIRFTIKDDPAVYENEITKGDFRKQVMFVGVTPEGEEIEYLLTEGLEHYGPTFSDYKEYFTWEEIAASIAKER